MSDQLMDTEPGGESTQYESIKTIDVPTDADSGAMGGTETSKDDSRVASDSAKAERGEKTAENIRYGQNISESGQGGMTTTSSGQANNGGYGAVEDQQDKSGNDTRSSEGYGAAQDMDKSIGG